MLLTKLKSQDLAATLQIELPIKLRRFIKDIQSYNKKLLERDGATHSRYIYTLAVIKGKLYIEPLKLTSIKQKKVIAGIKIEKDIKGDRLVMLNGRPMLAIPHSDSQAIDPENYRVIANMYAYKKNTSTDILAGDLKSFINGKTMAMMIVAPTTWLFVKGDADYNGVYDVDLSELNSIFTSELPQDLVKFMRNAGIIVYDGNKSLYNLTKLSN